MELSKISRPQLLEIDIEHIKIELLFPKKVFDKDTMDLVDLLVAPTLVLAQKDLLSSKFEIIFDEKMINDEIYKKFNSYTYSIGKIVRLAEINLDNLIKIVELYFSKHSTNEVFERNTDCRGCKQYEYSEKAHKLTFANLRKILSCIVNSDKSFHQILGLQTKEERKNFTKIYYNYIEDRDCFTHGKLFFLYPTFKPILRIKSESFEKYVKYEKENFTHNLEVYLYLDGILDEIRKVIQKI